MVTRVTNTNNSLTMIHQLRLVGEFVTPFLGRVGIAKLFCSFGVGFNGAF